MKKTIKDLSLEGKKVLLRLDLNVPINKQTHEITDCTRIMESLGTINYLCEHGAKVIICSHLGRPDGKVNLDYSLLPVAEKLGKLVKNKVTFSHDTVGKEAKKLTSEMENGDIVVLENLRFDKREEENDKVFAKELASLADVFVFDAFGTSHRKHASTYGVANYLPSAVGFLIGKELKVIGKILSNPDRPLVAVLGGAKVEDKFPVIERLLPRADYILVGGGMAYTFVKAKGGDVGCSLVDEKYLDLAKSLLENAGDKIILPRDNICNVSIDSDLKPKKFASDKIPDNYMGLDIGPKTIKLFKKYIKKAGTVVWNGPMGVFEKEQYARGTNKIAKYVAKTRAFTFVGGGDSAAAVVKSGYSKEINHLSTGGGASLKLLEGAALPGIDVIENVEDEVAESVAKPKTTTTKPKETKPTKVTKPKETKLKADKIKKPAAKVLDKAEKKTAKSDGMRAKKSANGETKTTRKTAAKSKPVGAKVVKEKPVKEVKSKDKAATKTVKSSKRDGKSIEAKKTVSKVARVAQKPRKTAQMITSKKED